MIHSSCALLIIGGGPGGRVSYMMARKMGIVDITLVINEDPTVICSLPYSVGRRLVPAGPDAEMVNLQNPERLPADTLKDVVRGNVIDLDLEKKMATISQSSGDVEITFEKAILATGAMSWIPPVNGVTREEVPRDKSFTWVMVGKDIIPHSSLAENVYVMRGAEDSFSLDRFASDKRKAVVVGTGAIGLEMAEALYDRGLEVILIEALPHAVPFLDNEMTATVLERLESKNIKVITDTQVREVFRDGISLNNGEKIHTDGIIFATGVKPNIAIAEGSGLGTEKGIIVDETMRTSHPDIYAVGDAVQILDGATGFPVLPLIGTLAMRQAMVAVMNIAGMPATLPPATVWGLTAVFDLHLGGVGWSEEIALRAGIETMGITIPYRTREQAMPEGHHGTWKIVVATGVSDSFRPGQIIGFQVVLDHESPLFLVERFIDIISRKETVNDLFGHYFVHSPYHNDIMDPYMNLMSMAREAMSKLQN